MSRSSRWPFPTACMSTQLGLDCRYCHNTRGEILVFQHPGHLHLHELPRQVLKDDSAPGAGAGERRHRASRSPGCKSTRCPITSISTIPSMSTAGVSCVECHGQINQMDEVYHAKPLSMSFCLDCHRDPAPRLRPLDKITDLDWKAGRRGRSNWRMGRNSSTTGTLQSLQNCSTCHR